MLLDHQSSIVLYPFRLKYLLTELPPFDQKISQPLTLKLQTTMSTSLMRKPITQPLRVLAIWSTDALVKLGSYQPSKLVHLRSESPARTAKPIHQVFIFFDLAKPIKALNLELSFGSWLKSTFKIKSQSVNNNVVLLFGVCNAECYSWCSS